MSQQRAKFTPPVRRIVEQENELPDHMLNTDYLDENYSSPEPMIEDEEDESEEESELENLTLVQTTQSTKSGLVLHYQGNTFNFCAYRKFNGIEDRSRQIWRCSQRNKGYLTKKQREAKAAKDRYCKTFLRCASVAT